MKYLLAMLVFFGFTGAALGAAARQRVMLGVAIAATAILGLTLRPLGGEDQVHPWPFTDISEAFAQPSRQQTVELVANLALFAPLGAVLAVGRRRVAEAVASGFALSLAIELAQLAVPGRTTSADDVLVNTAGAALGYLAASRVR